MSELFRGKTSDEDSQQTTSRPSWGTYADRVVDAEEARKSLDREAKAAKAHQQRVEAYTRNFGETIQKMAALWRDSGLEAATKYVSRGGKGKLQLDPRSPGSRYGLAAMHFVDWVNENKRSGAQMPDWSELTNAFQFFATGYATAVAEYQPEYMALWDIFMEHFEEHFG